MNSLSQMKSKEFEERLYFSELEIKSFLLDVEEELNQFCYWDICPSYQESI